MLLLLIFIALLSPHFFRHVDCGPLLEDKAEKRLTTTESDDPETVEELVSDHVTEGDILQLTDRNAVDRIWPTLDIPFTISTELAAQREQILAAMAMVSKHTCVSFHERTTERDYLFFKKSKGCASYVGFIGGQQPVFVGPRCTMGNVVHEILHGLGFHHEHTRKDREQYITIVPENIMSGRERNFKKKEGETFSLPYDLSSILHYGSGFFSANGQPTIIAKKDVKNMGQRVTMTKTDIARVRQLYSCDAFKPPTDSNVMMDSSFQDVDHNRLSDLREGNQSRVTPSASLQHLNATSRGPSNTSSSIGGSSKTSMEPSNTSSSIKGPSKTSRGRVYR